MKCSGGRAPKRPADAVIDRRVGRMILAIHLEIDPERRPARAEIGLPLQLDAPPGHGQRPFAPVLVVEGDLALLPVHVLHRDIEHAPRLGVDRQEDRIGLPPLLAQALEHDLHDVVIARGGAQEHRVEASRAVELGGADEFILEPERVEEPPQHGVVVMPEALMRAERVGHGGQRFLQMRREALGIGHVARHLAHPVEIVGKADQPRGDVADHLEGAADHGGAQHLAEGADMRQARRAIARLEEHMPLVGRPRPRSA